MSLQNRIWKVSVRSQNDLHVNAASVLEDSGSLVLMTADEVLAGKFNLSHVQGYSVALIRKITFVTRDIRDEMPDEPFTENKIWNVLLTSKRKHCFEAAEVKEHEGNLIFTDIQGGLTGKFTRNVVQGYAIEGDEPQDAPTFESKSCLDAHEQDT
jgi:hypothetical protein